MKSQRASGIVDKQHFDDLDDTLGGAAPADGTRLHVFVADALRELVVAAKAGCCDNLHWGAKVVGVRVTLAKATPALVSELLQAAWSGKAPPTLRAAVEKKKAGGRT